MEKEQYSLKVDFWNANGLSEENASDHSLQNEIRKYEILFLGVTWQYKDKLDKLHHTLGYLHDFLYRKNLK